MAVITIQFYGRAKAAFLIFNHRKLSEIQGHLTKDESPISGEQSNTKSPKAHRIILNYGGLTDWLRGKSMRSVEIHEKWGSLCGLQPHLQPGRGDISADFRTPPMLLFASSYKAISYLSY